MISRRWDKKEWKPGKKFRFGMIKVEEFAGETEKNGGSSGVQALCKSFTF